MDGKADMRGGKRRFSEESSRATSAVTPGQAAVYDGDMAMGGGWISRVPVTRVGS